MKKFLLTLLVIAMPLVAGALEKFGYFSFSEILNAMPDRAAADRNLADLRIKYDAEMKRAENEFNVKYEEFMKASATSCRASFTSVEAELQEMMEKNVAFRKEAERLLKQGAGRRLRTAAQEDKRGRRKGGQRTRLCVYTQHRRRRMPYIDASMSEDATIFIRELLGMNN